MVDLPRLHNGTPTKLRAFDTDQSEGRARTRACVDRFRHIAS